jgi:FdhD protein
VVAAEEPLEIRLREERLVVLMRTPGDDTDLVTGFLVSEGLLQRPDQIESVGPYLDERAHPVRNVMQACPVPGVAVTPPERRFYAASACGICGKSSIQAVALAACRVRGPLTIPGSTLTRLPELLRAAQPAFNATGGLHAAGLFDAEGHLLCAREDVGRHNAVDKVIGAAARAGRFPLHDLVLVVSSRASFEVCQKAAMAGIPIVAALSAPSSLAVALAQSVNMTLVGFLRGENYNIYSGAARIVRPACG